MTQYLIRSIEHNGETFTDIITVRENETYQVVEAESKEEAECKANRFVLEIDDAHWEGTRQDLVRILNKYTGLVDSEEYPVNIKFMPINQYKTIKYQKGQ